MCEKKQHNSVGAPPLDSLTAFIAYTQHSVFRNQCCLGIISYMHCLTVMCKQGRDDA